MVSLTSLINSNLIYVGIFTSIALLGIMLYRIARILCFSIVSGVIVINKNNKVKSGLQQFAHAGLIGHAIQFISLVISVILGFCISAIKTILFVCYSLLPFVILAMILVLVQYRWRQTMMILADLLNGDGALGATLRAFVNVPLNILDSVGTRVIPIYNLAIFIFLKMPLEILVWIFKHGSKDPMMQGIHSFGAMVPSLVSEGKVYIASISSPCVTIICSNVSYIPCMPIDMSLVAQTCLEPSTHELNFMPAFENA